MGEKSCRIVSEEGATMIELKKVRVQGDRLVVTGALMGAWDTDMYMGIDDIKAAVGLVDIPEIMEYLVKNVLEIRVSKEA